MPLPPLPLSQPSPIGKAGEEGKLCCGGTAGGVPDSEVPLASPENPPTVDKSRLKQRASDLANLPDAAKSHHGILGAIEPAQSPTD